MRGEKKKCNETKAAIDYVSQCKYAVNSLLNLNYGDSKQVMCTIISYSYIRK